MSGNSAVPAALTCFALDVALRNLRYVVANEFGRSMRQLGNPPLPSDVVDNQRGLV